MRKKSFSVALLLLCLFLSGCTRQTVSSGPIETPTVILGFSQLGWESAWRLANTQSIKDAAERAGVTLMYDNAEQKQERQIKAIRSFIAYQVDVIAFSPIVETGWDNVLNEAREAGIPVLVSDRMVSVEDENLYAGFIGSDFYAEGVSGAEYLIRKCAGREDVRIVEISGTEDSTPMLQRAQGFRDTLSGQENMTIIASVSGDFLRTKGRECMRALLAENERIDVLYSHNDAMTLGAISAIEDAGLVPGQDILIITIDAEQAAIDLLKEGKVNCVIECNPDIGDGIMELVRKLARGESIERNNYSAEAVFTDFDPDLESIPPRRY